MSPHGQTELKRSNSQIMRALAVDTQTETSQSTKQSTNNLEEKRGIPKVRSGLNVAAVYVEVK